MRHAAFVVRRLSSPPRRSGAFTLVELMISIALVLVLMIGISKVFSITSQTVGTSQAYSEVYRSARAAQGVLCNDFANMAGSADAPFIVITSGTQGAFANQKDKLGNIIGTDPLSNDLDGNGIGEPIDPYIYNERNHRVDTMAFFVRSTQRRQTGDGNASLVSSMSSQEAYIWYGHLWQPNNNNSADPNDPAKYFDGTPSVLTATYPGFGDATTNPNNYYAQDWILGRQVILLKEAAQLTAANGGQYALSTAGNVPFQFGPNIAATGGSATTNATDGVGRFTLANSRYDVAAGTLGGVRAGAVATGFPIAGLAYADTTSATPLVGRFQGADFFDKPIDDTLGSAKLAKTVPVFVPGCTQFIVEFAGDYLTQVGGSADAPGADGEIDYVVVAGQRQTRWYGMPRNINGTARIDPNAEGDVGPVAFSAAGQQTFERVLAPVTSTTGDYTGKYVCVWTSANAAQFPRMYRLTIVVDDPTGQGRLTDAQSFEYVFTR